MELKVEKPHLYRMPRKVDPTSIENRTFKESLGKAIVALRRERKLSQEQLALAAGIDRTFMSQLERGEVNVSTDTLMKIAQTLDVLLSTLVLRAEERSS